MNKIILLVLLVALVGCSTPVQRYYLNSNLNTISIGMDKAQLLNNFPGEKVAYGAPAMMVRAAKKNNDILVEVAEVLMTDGASQTVAYWFLFENSKLIQWGQPADWKEVAARYEISYSPSVGGY
ncbi:hypothetical protein ACRN9A_21535 [Shewanella frigidimarina]|uniref:hypothetical protein n=1 Tax=Shewanella frigidimarina TaxID=56812 RepID=UPI003D7C026A